jgi:hypothetical protein
MGKSKRFRVALHHNVARNETIHCLDSIRLLNLAIYIQSECESVLRKLGNIYVTDKANWGGLELSCDGIVNVN